MLTALVLFVAQTQDADGDVASGTAWREPGGAGPRDSTSLCVKLKHASTRAPTPHTACNPHHLRSCRPGSDCWGRHLSLLSCLLSKGFTFLNSCK